MASGRFWDSDRMGRISPKFVHSGKARDEMKPAKKISAQFKFVARPMVYSSPLMPLLIIRTRTTCWNPRNFIFFHPSSPRRRRRPTRWSRTGAGAKIPSASSQIDRSPFWWRQIHLHPHPFPSISPLQSGHPKSAAAVGQQRRRSSRPTCRSW